MKKEEKDSGEKKFTNSSPADIPRGKQSSFTHQTSFTYLKKDQKQHGGPWHKRGQRQSQDSSIIDANITLKKEEKDISQVKCLYNRKKGHYANWYPQKGKQEPKNK